MRRRHSRLAPPHSRCAARSEWAASKGVHSNILGTCLAWDVDTTGGDLEHLAHCYHDAADGPDVPRHWRILH